MASKIKVDTLETANGTGSITLNNPIASFTSTGIDDNATSTAITIDASEQVGINTASPAKPLDVTGDIRTSTGILFGTDTAAANTLDDYEEGTYMPTLTGASGSFSLSGGSDTAYYTKIGRVVHVQGYISASVDNSASGAIKMSLPFAPTNLTDDGEYVMSHLSLTNTGTTTAGTKQLFILSDGAYIHNVTDAGIASYLTHAEVDGVWQMGFGFSYIVQ